MPSGTRRRRAAVLLLASVTATVVATVGPGAPAPEVHADDPPWTTPTVPPKCTNAQLQTGQVAGCVVMGGSGLPEVYGWPMPPFPSESALPGEWSDVGLGATGPVVVKIQQALQGVGPWLAADGQFGPITESRVKEFQTARSLPVTGVVDAVTAEALGVQAGAGVGAFPPAGWWWSGWGYNGSPALATWEQGITGNSAAIGSVRVNQMRLNPDVLPLFEGFVTEIVQRGYRIRDLGGYVFRCTASTAKNCAGLTRAALSNHAYGLAIDFNTAENPMRTYYSSGYATACEVPMQTDIPRWVVQTAEKWGLYWGGYGWSSGCSSPAQVKSSASRDPMHFEFRGTPAQAAAILRANGVGRFCVDLVDSSGAHRERCTWAPEVVPQGSRLLVSTGAPAGATAALVNIALVGAAAPGYATAEGCGEAPTGPRSWANGNAGPGRTASNLSVVRLDGQGRFCLFLSAPMHAVVDVQGWFAPPAIAGAAGSTFVPLAPHRVLDTRDDGWCTPEGACEAGRPPANSEVAVPLVSVSSDATAVLANLTATAGAAPGYLTADRCADLVPGPQQRANVNFPAGATVGNLGVVPVEAEGDGSRLCVYAKESAHVVVDVQGYFEPATTDGLRLTVISPARITDTRVGARPAAGSVVRVSTPPGVSAVLANLAITDAASNGYATADRCSALVPGPQDKATVSMRPGITTANLAVVPVDPDGAFCVYLSASAHLVVDVQGAFAPDGLLEFVPVTPSRLLDTRAAAAS